MVAAALNINHKTAMALLSRMEREGIVGPMLTKLKRRTSVTHTFIEIHVHTQAHTHLHSLSHSCTAHLFTDLRLCACDCCLGRQVLKRVEPMPVAAALQFLPQSSQQRQQQQPLPKLTVMVAETGAAAAPSADLPAVAAVTATEPQRATSPGQLARTLSQTHISESVVR